LENDGMGISDGASKESGLRGVGAGAFTTDESTGCSLGPMTGTVLAASSMAIRRCGLGKRRADAEA
jgi:hypothetical protein